jgi:hypothetical protein
MDSRPELSNFDSVTFPLFSFCLDHFYFLSLFFRRKFCQFGGLLSVPGTVQSVMQVLK